MSNYNYVSIKLRLQRQLLQILNVLKEQGGEPMGFTELSNAVGFSINETPQLAEMWRTCEKIGFDMGTKTVWYKHEFQLQCKEDVLEFLRNHATKGGIELAKIKETFAGAMEAVEELEREGSVIVLRGKEGMKIRKADRDKPPPPRLVYYNSLNLKSEIFAAEDAIMEYPISEFASYWHKVTLPADEEEIKKELGEAGLAAAEATLHKVAGRSSQVTKKRRGRKVKITNTHLEDVDLTKGYVPGAPIAGGGSPAVGQASSSALAPNK